jgi:hypothetical protein
MKKIFICDESKIHHHDACIAGKDFGDCYDRAAHPVAAVLLQSFDIPQPAINILLGTMETMRFFLHTGFLENWQHHMVEPMRNILLGMDRGMPQAPVLQL